MFTENDRKVFKFFNGISEVYADPLAIERRLRQCMGGAHKAAEIVAALNSDNLDNADSVSEIFSNAVAEAFGVQKRFDQKTGEGYTEKNLRELWDKFQKWQEDKKKDHGSGPGSPQPIPHSPLPRQPGR